MFIDLEAASPSFSCHACGSCCSHIRGFIPETDKKFIQQYAFGKLPVVQLVPVDRMTFPLWDWEASRFREWQDEVGVDAHIRPLRAIMDKLSGKAIVVTYFMDGETDACPFLQDKKCSIYRTKRAYVCRLFPFSKSPFSFEDGIKKNQTFGDCGAMETLLPLIPEEGEWVSALSRMFPGGEFLNAVQNDLIIEWSNRTIVELMKNKKIDPVMNIPHLQIRNAIDHVEKIDFTQFLVDVGHYSQNEMDALIRSFDGNEDAKKKIAQPGGEP